MKKMLLAATIAGAAVASTILYLRNRKNNYKLDIKGTGPRLNNRSALQELA